MRVVIVGGSPSVRTELAALVGNDIAVRLIDGTARRRQDQAQADLAWADLVLVWGSSQLDHTVSSHYTDSGAARRKVVAVGQRGIVALLGEGAIHLEAR